MQAAEQNHSNEQLCALNDIVYNNWYNFKVPENNNDFCHQVNFFFDMM